MVSKTDNPVIVSSTLQWLHFLRPNPKWWSSSNRCGQIKACGRQITADYEVMPGWSCEGKWMDWHYEVMPGWSCEGKMDGLTLWSNAWMKLQGKNGWTGKMLKQNTSCTYVHCDQFLQHWLQEPYAQVAPPLSTSSIPIPETGLLKWHVNWLSSSLYNHQYSFNQKITTVVFTRIFYTKYT